MVAPVRTAWGMGTTLRTSTAAAKPMTNSGTSGGRRLDVGAAVARRRAVMTRMTGPSISTRASLTTMATLRAVPSTMPRAHHLGDLVNRAADETARWVVCES